MQWVESMKERSVATANYDDERYVTAAAESVLGLPRDNVEALLVDDG